MYFIIKFLRLTIHNNFFLIFGIFIGVGLSSLIVQLTQNNCFFLFRFDYSKKFVVPTSTEKVILVEGDFDPVINVGEKPQKAQKNPQGFVRPRYYRTELGIRNKLFTAVLTSPGTILDYGISFNKTTKHLFEKTVFFTESKGKKIKNDGLGGVVQFLDSRILLKPFHLLKYISDNYIDDYDYFFIIRDTSYVRGRYLNRIINKISVVPDIHAGGKKQDDSSSYCLIGAGILISNLVLRKMAQNLDWCVKNAFSDSDDANLGRCIFYSTGLPCTNEIRGFKLSSFLFKNEDDSISIEKLLEDKAFNKALTFWPMPSPAVMFLLHIYFSELELFEKKAQITDIQKKILKKFVILPDNTTLKIPWPVGSPLSVNPTNRFDVLRWDYFTDSKIYLKSDFSNVEELNGADLLDVKYIINASVDFIKEKYKGHLQYVGLVNGYRRFDPTRGMDYILDMDFKDVISHTNIHKRLEISKRLGPVELIPVPFVTENTRINMVLAVGEANKQEVLKFMENYAAVCMTKNDKTYLMLVLLYEKKYINNKYDMFRDIKSQAIKYSRRYKREGNKISWITLILPPDYIYVPPKKPREETIGLNNGILTLAIFDLVIKKLSSDYLILHCTSNMEIREDYLNRVRMNTIKDWQVFSPIPFSEFHPDIVYSDHFVRPKKIDINKNYGHYDTLNTEHISFYVKDYREARRKIENVIPNIMNDQDLAELPRLLFKVSQKNIEEIRNHLLNDNFESSKLPDDSFIKTLIKISLHSIYGLFFNLEYIHILRAVEPELRLRHTVFDCKLAAHSNDLLKTLLFEQCIKKRNLNTGTRSQLGEFILNYMKKDKP